MSAIQVTPVMSASADVLAACRRLIPQLSSLSAPISAQELEEIIESDTTVLFAARSGQEIVGLLTLAIFRIPTGVRAWIEDVVVDNQARGKGALTGACFLELEAQPPELGVDFFNTFQETSRHFRQKWFEAADFCIFNVGGVGTLEEIGIEMCNLKLGIRPRVPYVFFNSKFWGDLRRQLREMIRTKRAPAWIADYILFTDDPDEVVRFYRKTLQVL